MIISNKKTSFIHKIIDNFIIRNTKKKICTRFPPDPNGYLHIGHAKSLFINFEISEKYNGQCNLRFDDTNPDNNHQKYISVIQKDIKWLGFRWTKKTKYASMYFQKIYEFAIELIKKKLAYVDKLKKNDIRKYRGTLNTPGINSPYRNQTIEENMLLFQNMKLGNFPEGQVCLRAKIDMQSPCIIMRDPILYRIKFSKHHRTKNQWCIYPTYDFAHCISDAIEGITHSLCTLEFQDNKQLYNWIMKNITIHHQPKQYEYARLNIEYFVLSKRKLNTLIQKKIIKQWNDPRLPTLSGLKRRGYTASAIRNFCNNLGITKKNNLVEISSLESCIRKELNLTACRTMAIIEPIEIIICNIPINYQQEIKIFNHPNNHDMGEKNIIFSKELYIEKEDFQENIKKRYQKLTLGQTVKLKYSYIITAHSIKKNKDNSINKIFCTIHIKNKNQKYKIIHWLSKKHAQRSEFRIYNHLFTTKNPSSKKNLLSYINNKSLIKKYGFINKYIVYNSKKNTYQFERQGYFIIDNILSTKKNIIFNQIISLKQNWKNKI
ncbi:glutamine--tRNA ligase/YqeY domain fusion protein [Buchnera aphidicola]|uniref:Glutamine--tRNA ligase n=1 Tax=Buchnera aphidicola (Sarucallis kahawaluokalani) TaxID=1241878 RepID=A0A4D6Y814_9GAMM|nr:glutamine--tRNA ligase/YqeY domain fusion protein [Buchnera aphidicola]QCI26066.1 glutamine--tRNA ligase/YqeY domain fusion protein [Buchnera aphidicola (Sarucallis kahawaluokalani)]